MSQCTKCESCDEWSPTKFLPTKCVGRCGHSGEAHGLPLNDPVICIVCKKEFRKSQNVEGNVPSYGSDPTEFGIHESCFKCTIYSTQLRSKDDSNILLGSNPSCTYATESTLKNCEPALWVVFVEGKLQCDSCQRSEAVSNYSKVANSYDQWMRER
jgi:hypothetical protein